MMTPLRETVIAVGISAALLLATLLGFRFAPWVRDSPLEDWPPATQTAAHIASIVGISIGALVVALILAVFVILLVLGINESRADKRENHRFVNESTAARLVIARYNAAGERDTDLDVPLDRQLWLAPTEDVIAFDAYRVATAPYAALLDHAPLYDKQEGQTFAEATKRPSIVHAHNRLWTQWAVFGSADRKNGRLEAIHDAFRPLIASGAVITHIDIDTWKPRVPADAKFRTHWKWSPPAEPAAT